MSATTQQILALLDQYHLTNYPEIVKKYRENLTLTSVFPVISMVKDKLKITESYVGEIMQPYQSDFTPKEGLKFANEILEVHYAKADVKIDPNEFRATHLAEYLTQAPSEEHELVRLAYQEFLARAARDTNMALIKGVYKEPEEGTPGKAIDSCNGYLKFLANAIEATKINPVETGAITADDIVDQVESIYMSIPEDLRTADLRCYMSEDLKRKYFFGIRDRFGMHNDYTGWNEKVDGTDVPVVGLPFMGRSQRIAFSIHGNFVQLQLNPTDMFKFDAEKSERKIKFMMDWSLGFGAKIVGKVGAASPADQYIWCNDVDEPAAGIQPQNED